MSARRLIVLAVFCGIAFALLAAFWPAIVKAQPWPRPVEPAASWPAAERMPMRPPRLCPMQGCDVKPKPWSEPSREILRMEREGQARAAWMLEWTSKPPYYPTTPPPLGFTDHARRLLAETPSCREVNPAEKNCLRDDGSLFFAPAVRYKPLPHERQDLRGYWQPTFIRPCEPGPPDCRRGFDGGWWQSLDTTDYNAGRPMSECMVADSIDYYRGPGHPPPGQMPMRACLRWMPR